MPGAAQASESTASRTTPAKVAARIMVDGLERDKLHVCVGRDAQLMSLAIRLAPRLAIGLVQKQMTKVLETASA